jgi:phosphate transport system substrate-binding protein
MKRIITNSWSHFIIGLSFVIITFISFSCNSNNNSNYDDTPTSGSIKISVDETFAPILESQVYTFEHIYQYAKVKAEFKPEGNVFDDLIADSVRLVVATRKLNTSENEYFAKAKIIPKTTIIAYDAIALVINKENKDSLLDLNTLKSILSGKINSWKKLDPSSKLSNINIVFDNPVSSTVRYIKDFIGTDSLPKNCFAVKTNKAVIDYVTNNKDAIGIIGVNWISDFNDQNTQMFLKNIRVIGLKSNNPDADPSTYYKPYQYFLKEQFYPLMREVYLISREARAGLGSGFSAFVAGEKGQRIILKSGLLPATAPTRLVEIYH